jgi:hypothetical protein
VIDQGRSKSYSLVVFYVLAMLICLVRILMYFAGVILFSQWFLNNYVAGHSFLYNIGYVVAIYLAIVLGLYQNSSMIELSIRIRYPLNSGQDLLNLKKMIKVSFIITTAFAVLAVCCMILFTVGITQSLNQYIQGCKTECNTTGCKTVCNST